MMRRIWAAVLCSMLASGAAAQSAGVNFIPGWCPRADEIAEMQQQASLELNGCCAVKAVPKPEASAAFSARWAHRITANAYPTARCDASPISADEEARRRDVAQEEAVQRVDAAKRRA